jgi:hypothetical protein
LSRKEYAMKTYPSICVGIFLALALGMGWAQVSDPQAPPDTSQSPAGAPAAAIGPNTPTTSDNPPISSLDSPSLEPLSPARSFLQPGLHVSQSVDSNVSNAPGSSAARGVTRALGSLELQRLWANYQTSLDYIGGGAFYSGSSRTTTQLHQFEFDQRILWRTGQLSLRDSFSYFPEGSFGYGAYGGAGSIGGLSGGGLAGGGLGGSTFFGSGQFASIGQTPRISNTALGQVTESLSPRASVTMTGSYGLVHYLDNTLGFINSRQIAAQAGYNYELNRKDQVALVYGYQSFQYPSSFGADFNSHVINVLYGHRVSGRMDVVLGGGPQITLIDNPLTGSSSRISMSGRAALHYRFPRSSIALSYDHFNTSGSGLFAGATSDVTRLAWNHPISRQWNLNADIGFTHNTRLQAVTIVNSRTFNYLYMGGGLRRQLGRYFSAYVSYQFNYLLLDSSFCGTSTSCSSNSQRHVGLIGLDWHPHPIRID